MKWLKREAEILKKWDLNLQRKTEEGRKQKQHKGTVNKQNSLSQLDSESERETDLKVEGRDDPLSQLC